MDTVCNQSRHGEGKQPLFSESAHKDSTALHDPHPFQANRRTSIVGLVKAARKRRPKCHQLNDDGACSTAMGTDASKTECLENLQLSFRDLRPDQDLREDVQGCPPPRGLPLRQPSMGTVLRGTPDDDSDDALDEDLCLSGLKSPHTILSDEASSKTLPPRATTLPSKADRAVARPLLPKRSSTLPSKVEHPSTPKHRRSFSQSQQHAVPGAKGPSTKRSSVHERNSSTVRPAKEASRSGRITKDASRAGRSLKETSVRSRSSSNRIKDSAESSRTSRSLKDPSVRSRSCSTRMKYSSGSSRSGRPMKDPSVRSRSSSNRIKDSIHPGSRRAQEATSRGPPASCSTHDKGRRSRTIQNQGRRRDEIVKDDNPSLAALPIQDVDTKSVSCPLMSVETLQLTAPTAPPLMDESGGSKRENRQRSQHSSRAGDSDKVSRSSRSRRHRSESRRRTSEVVGEQSRPKTPRSSSVKAGQPSNSRSHHRSKSRSGSLKPRHGRSSLQTASRAPQAAERLETSVHSSCVVPLQLCVDPSGTHLSCEATAFLAVSTIETNVQLSSKSPKIVKASPLRISRRGSRSSHPLKAKPILKTQGLADGCHKQWASNQRLAKSQAKSTAPSSITSSSGKSLRQRTVPLDENQPLAPTRRSILHESCVF
jgi:hypothetical protein